LVRLRRRTRSAPVVLPVRSIAGCTMPGLQLEPRADHGECAPPDRRRGPDNRRAWPRALGTATPTLVSLLTAAPRARTRTSSGKSGDSRAGAAITDPASPARCSFRAATGERGSPARETPHCLPTRLSSPRRHPARGRRRWRPAGCEAAHRRPHRRTRPSYCLRAVTAPSLERYATPHFKPQSPLVRDARDMVQTAFPRLGWLFAGHAGHLALVRDLQAPTMYRRFLRAGTARRPAVARPPTARWVRAPHVHTAVISRCAGPRGTTA